MHSYVLCSHGIGHRNSKIRVDTNINPNREPISRNKNNRSPFPNDTGTRRPPRERLPSEKRGREEGEEEAALMEDLNPTKNGKQ